MKYILNIAEFNEIVSGIKALKSNYVTVKGNMLLGLDEQNTHLKTYNMNTNITIPPFTIITKELGAKFYANITDTNIIIDTDMCSIYCPNNLSYANEVGPMISFGNCLSSSQMIYDRIMIELFNITNNGKILYKEITDEPGFLEINNLKSSAGAKIYIPEVDNTYKMYLFKGAIPVNKSDKVFLTIYDLGHTFIGKFTVHKKKLNPVDVYFRFIKI